MKKVICVAFIVILLIFQNCSLTRKFIYYPQKRNQTGLMLSKCLNGQVEDIKIPIGRNKYLQGWLIVKDLIEYPTIIYFGGNAEEVSSNIPQFTQRLTANIVLVNYRGYGLSDGAPKERLLKVDSENIYDFIIVKYHIPHDKIFVFGRSLGTGIASYLANKKALPKLILVSPYDSIERVAYKVLPKILVKVLLVDKYKTISFCREIKSKTLVITSKNDEVVPIENTLRLYDSLLCDKRIK